MLLQILEEKARKEFVKEKAILKSSLTELQNQAEKFEDIKVSRLNPSVTYKYLQKFDSFGQCFAEPQNFFMAPAPQH